MKKKILKRMLALTIVFLMIISTPFYISENINNNPYVYAAVTFAEAMESELLKQSLIPMLISAGLVFTSSASAVKARDGLIHYFIEINEDPVNPQEPEGPEWKDIIIEMLKGVTLVSAGYGIGKHIIEIPQMLWELIKSFVDDNYDEGDNYSSDYNELTSLGVEKNFTTQISMDQVLISCDYNGNLLQIIMAQEPDYDPGMVSPYMYVNGVKGSKVYGALKNTSVTESTNVKVKIIVDYYAYFYAQISPYVYGSKYIPISDLEVLPPIIEQIPIYGYPNIVDNANYDWNNNYTDTKVIPIPVEMDIYGNPKIDENGYYLPSTDVDEWLDVQPTEIPNLDPTGTPIPEIPPFPDIENPNDDEQTGIMIYIGNILQIIVGQLSKIVEGVKTIVSNTNQLVFNTPSPVFDPITGEQIDPETGQPVEPEPEASTGDGIIGNGIDTNIPTDFEWGDFRHLLDIFFIFIYFIVILILILLKFLQVVFTGLPAIAANTDLFTQYPNILEGVNYVKNLQVGGMSITVQQAFEYIFLIFFYIFIIKQIRKLYNAHVFEQPAENQRNTKDMKMDYYENSKHHESTNLWKGIEHSHDVKSNSYNDDNYENIKFTGWSDDK